VLEQRIGRLDRIGQKNTITIHTCLSDDASRSRLHWYHKVLDCIEKTNPAAGVMHDQWYEQYQHDPEVIGEKVRQETAQWLAQLKNGRDRLLEMNSCRQPQADALVESVLALDANNNPQPVLTMAADLLNIHMEHLGDQRFSVIPSDQMLVPMIPGIPAEGCEITFDRATATAREDVQFITWDHPLMQGLTELITTSELGVSTVALLPNKALKPGMLFFEAVFTLTIQSGAAKEAGRYLSESLLRIVLTKGNTKNLNTALPQSTLSSVIENASKAIRKAVVKDYQKDIYMLAEQAQAMAESEMQSVIQRSIEGVVQRHQAERARLEELQERNEHIVCEDIEGLDAHYQGVIEAIKEHCKPDISAVRLLVTYKPER